MKRPSTAKTVLLMDGDVLSFIAAAAAQHTYVDAARWHWPIANEVEGETILENLIFTLKRDLKADEVRLYLTDHNDNWRWQVAESYKTNRVGERPQLLDYLKGYLVEKYKAETWPGLEADDVLSILMTTPVGDYDGYHCTGSKGCDPENIGSECEACSYEDPDTRYICVGRDKDFKTIPGLHHSIKQDLPGAVRSISQWEADRFHMVQTLAGDAVDGFAGCPGIGMLTAGRIIDDPVRLVPQEGIKTRGVNSGQAVTRWMSEPTTDYWACIVSHYRKAGKTEADALVAARLAHLLRHGEYDRATEEVTLWTPEKLLGVGQ